MFSQFHDPHSKYGYYTHIWNKVEIKMADERSRRDETRNGTTVDESEKEQSWKFVKVIKEGLTRQLLSVLLLGQLLSLLLCSTGIISQILALKYDVKTPTFQSFLNYLLLSLVFGVQLVYPGQQFKEVLVDRGWKYFILALIDVEANFLLVKAYQYTNLTSIQVLDCFSLVSVLVLSWFFLKVRFKAIHCCGVVFCLLGTVSLIVADYYGSRYYGPGTNQAIGDFLVLSGAILYGVSNVAEEFVVKTFNKVEFLGMIGMFGSIISGIQVSIIERSALSTTKWNYENVLLLVAFGVVLFLLYTVMPVVMKMSSATVVNLSLLTADLYSLLFGLFLFHYKFSVLYFVAFTLVIIGVTIYNLRPTPVARRNDYGRLEEDSVQSTS